MLKGHCVVCSIQSSDQESEEMSSVLFFATDFTALNEFFNLMHFLSQLENLNLEESMLTWSKHDRMSTFEKT